MSPSQGLRSILREGAERIVLSPQEAYLKRMVSTHLGAHTVFKNLTELSACMEDMTAKYAHLMLSQGLADSFDRIF